MKNPETEDFAFSAEQKARLKKALERSTAGLYESIYDFYIAMSSFDEEGKPITTTYEQHRITESQATDYAQKALKVVTAAFEDELPYTNLGLRKRLQDAVKDFTSELMGSQSTGADQQINMAVIRHFDQICDEIYDHIIYSPAQLHKPICGRVH